MNRRIPLPETGSASNYREVEGFTSIEKRLKYCSRALVRTKVLDPSPVIEA
jgi:hypothetical protein